MKIISIANHKGGVGKTTTALNIAAGLKKVGKKILLIDLDPQGNLSEYLGYNFEGKTITDMMLAEINSQAQEIISIIKTSEEGLDYIPSNITLSGADIFLSTVICREQVLKRILKRDEFKVYDYIIIDCLPSLGILLTNALATSDELIIPVQAQKFALDGLKHLEQVYKMVKNNINQSLEIKGILLTMTDNTNMAKAVEQSLLDTYKELVFKTKIRRSVEATNSTYQQKSLVNSKNSKLGEDYINVTTEYLDRS